GVPVGRRRGGDPTAGETNIPFPTDSGLLGGGVRVVSRLLRRAEVVLGEAASGLGEAFRSRVRTVRRIAQQLHRLARRKGEQGRGAMKAAYTRLIAAVKRTAAQGRRGAGAVPRPDDSPQARPLAGRPRGDVSR